VGSGLHFIFIFILTIQYIIKKQRGHIAYAVSEVLPKPTSQVKQRPRFAWRFAFIL
jgi:hypothetical protein